MTLTDALAQSLHQRLPAEAFARLLETAMPSLVQEPEWIGLPALLLETASSDEDPAWATALDLLLQQREASEWAIAPLMSALRKGVPRQALVQTLWDRLGPAMDEAPFFQVLSLTLQHGWDDLMGTMLTTHPYRDLSNVYMMSSPYQAVRTLDDLNRLVQAGFDLMQNTKNEVTGHKTLLQRSVTSFRRRRANGTWTSQGAKTELLQRILADHPESPMVMVRQVLNAHAAPRELHALLDAIGPAWLDARGKTGGTVVHAVCVRRPSMLPSLLKRPDVRARGLVWSAARDDHGSHPWEMIWLNDWFASNPLPEADSVQAVEDQVRALPDGPAWLATIPHRPGLGALLQQITAASTVGLRLPSFNNTAWWDGMVKQGGLDAPAAWAEVANKPWVQQQLDHVIWEQANDHGLIHPEGWMNLDLWCETDHPWLATYQLLSSMTLVDADAKPGSVADCQHRMHLDRAVQAINNGADVAQVQRWIDTGRLRMGDGWSKVWHRELRVAWERKTLAAMTTPPMNVGHAPRRRL